MEQNFVGRFVVLYCCIHCLQYQQQASYVFLEKIADKLSELLLRNFVAMLLIFINHFYLSIFFKLNLHILIEVCSHLIDNIDEKLSVIPVKGNLGRLDIFFIV